MGLPSEDEEEGFEESVASASSAPESPSSRAPSSSEASSASDPASAAQPPLQGQPIAANKEEARREGGFPSPASTAFTLEKVTLPTTSLQLQSLENWIKCGSGQVSSLRPRHEVCAMRCTSWSHVNPPRGFSLKSTVLETILFSFQVCNQSLL